MRPIVVAAALAAVAALGLAACKPDPIVGTWANDDQPPKTFELRADGSMTAPPTHLPDGMACSDPKLASSPEADACAHADHWDRDGSTYTLTRMVFVQNPNASFQGMFNAEPACACRVLISGTATLDGDTLAIEGGKERAHRVAAAH